MCSAILVRGGVGGQAADASPGQHMQLAITLVRPTANLAGTALARALALALVFAATAHAANITTVLYSKQAIPNAGRSYCGFREVLQYKAWCTGSNISAYVQANMVREAGGLTWHGMDIPAPHAACALVVAGWTPPGSDADRYRQVPHPTCLPSQQAWPRAHLPVPMWTPNPARPRAPPPNPRNPPPLPRPCRPVAVAHRPPSAATPMPQTTCNNATAQCQQGLLAYQGMACLNRTLCIEERGPDTVGVPACVVLQSTAPGVDATCDIRITGAAADGRWPAAIRGGEGAACRIAIHMCWAVGHR